MQLPSDADIGKAIVKWRQLAGLSLRDASKSTGIPFNTLSRMEHGRHSRSDHYRTIWNHLVQEETRLGKVLL